jgi:formate hydrogenlyase subunit 4
LQPSRGEPAQEIGAHAVIESLLQVAALLVASPLLLGIIHRTKAIAAGRRGPGLLQPYLDLRKLAAKELVVSEVTSWIFVAAPAVAVVSTLLAGLMIPLGSFDAAISFSGDFVLFAYLLALGRFFTAAAALDTGSPFEGMGAAREVGFAWLTEPALFFAFLVLARLSGSLSFDQMLHATEGGAWVQRTAPLVLTAAGLFIVLLAECSRIPVDDPNTHLELTMIHEVMVLDYSGPLLGVIEYAASLKLFVLSAMLLHVVAPTASVVGWPGFSLFLAGIVGVAVVVGVIESTMARLRMLHVPILLIAAVLSCGFALLLLSR